MANTKGANVIRIDTTAAFSDAREIVGISYKPGSGSPAVTIRDTDSSGAILWEHDGTTDIFEDPYIRNSRGVHVTVAGSGTLVFLYLR